MFAAEPKKILLPPAERTPAQRIMFAAKSKKIVWLRAELRLSHEAC
jgi:hypothetical protein